MVVTRKQTAPEPLSLFHALLHGNRSMVQRLLAGSGADQLALVAPATNFTVLHAAVLSKCSALLPQLAALCAAAGVPVDAALQLGGGSMNRRRAAAKQLLLGMGVQRPQHIPALCDGATPLSLSVSFQDPAAIHALLQAGARPAASRMVAEAVCSLAGGCEAGQLVRPLLRHGLDPLLAVDPNIRSACLLIVCHSVQSVDAMLAHLEEQRAAGSLRLGSRQRCLQLLEGACRSSNPPPPLARFGVSQLVQLVGVPAAGQDDDGAALDSLLLCAARAGNPTVLSALLASQLPLNMAAAERNVRFGGVGWRGYSLLAVAAMSPQPDACVRLLNQAGAVPTASDLYCAIDSLCPGGAAALLACGIPAMDTSQPTAVAPLPPGEDSQAAWSCPIHRALHAASTQCPWVPLKHKAALQLVEVLRAAGFRPATYTNAALPGFTRPWSDRVLAVLDPFELFDVERCKQQGLPVARRYSVLALPAWLLFGAQDGCWSPATHHHWPEDVKVAARTLLLAANRSSRMASGGRAAEGGSNEGRPADRRRRRQAAAAPSSSTQQAGCTLGALPAELVLRIVKAVAEPLSAWL